MRLLDLLDRSGLVPIMLCVSEPFTFLSFVYLFQDPFYYNIYGIKFVTICPGLTDTPFNVDIGDRFYREDAKDDGLKAQESWLHQT